MIDGNNSAKYGIYVYRNFNQTTNITIRNCKIKAWKNANIYFGNTNGNKIENVTSLSSLHEGIYLHSSSGNKLINCIVNNNYYGIYLRSSSNNQIINCTFTNNIEYGIYLRSSSNNQIISNKIEGNLYGIYFRGNSTLNLIYNNLFNNSNNFYFFGKTYHNNWNVSKSKGPSIVGGQVIGGNFWASPENEGYSQSCNDTDKDGFCDSPFILTLDNVDYLPLSENIEKEEKQLSSGNLVSETIKENESSKLILISLCIIGIIIGGITLYYRKKRARFS